jgi:hypothetical protein
MKTGTLFSVAALLSFALSALSIPESAAAASASVMYRYTNEDGNRVFSYTLPPEQARRGYERVDLATGRVQAVAPQLAPEDMALRERREQALAACRSELQRIHSLYSTERDIGHAQEAAQESLTRRIGQIESNATLAENELERLQLQAADAERAGRSVPPDLIRRIDHRRAQIESLHAEAALRRQEQDQSNQRYQRERDRFREGTCPEPEVANLSEAAR